MRAFIASALFLLAFTAQARVSTAEGRLQTAAPTAPDNARQSSYSDAHANIEAPATVDEQSHGAEKQAASVSELSTARSAYEALSAKSSWFRIYDSGSSLRRDRDGDGHHSEFEIRFDADVLIGDALVYAKLYLRRVGDTGNWRLYHTTQDFWIYGESGTDDYFVTTILDDGFPTGDYDVLIDLYESGYSGIVATLTAYDDASLAYLPLEERGLDIPIEISGYAISGVSTALLIDDDRDGFYSRFRIAIDPDTDFGSAYVYAELWVRPQGGEWILEHVSDDFLADASGTADAYSFTADWINGYPTANYDVQIDLYDATTGLLAASAGSERPALSRIPLEDQTRDRYANPPSQGSGGSTSSREHGGGALSWWLVCVLLGLLTFTNNRHDHSSPSKPTKQSRSPRLTTIAPRTSPVAFR